jgi:hypothetical protein
MAQIWIDNYRFLALNSGPGLILSGFWEGSPITSSPIAAIGNAMSVYDDHSDWWFLQRPSFGIMWRYKLRYQEPAWYAELKHQGLL